jgi:alcohol-forming fatty acyl-CoA reductase
MHCNDNYLADIMPVDVCANILIALGWRNGVKKYYMFTLIDNNHFKLNISLFRNKEPLVCNVTQSGINPITWGEALALGKQNVLNDKNDSIYNFISISLGRKHLYDNPFTITLWYPDGSPKSNWYLHYACVLLFHFIPAYFIDFLLILLRKKPL